MEAIACRQLDQPRRSDKGRRKDQGRRPTPVGPGPDRPSKRAHRFHGTRPIQGKHPGAKKRTAGAVRNQALLLGRKMPRFDQIDRSPAAAVGEQFVLVAVTRIDQMRAEGEQALIGCKRSGHSIQAWPHRLHVGIQQQPGCGRPLRCRGSPPGQKIRLRSSRSTLTAGWFRASHCGEPSADALSTTMNSAMASSRRTDSTTEAK